jgi:hypothetical protein
MRPLLESEWGVYSAAALSEFAQHRAEHEAALQETGHSAWFNSRVSVASMRHATLACITCTGTLDHCFYGTKRAKPPTPLQAEALYLRQLLATGLPPGSSPLADSAPRYLAVLEANSSWTFAQRKHAVQVRIVRCLSVEARSCTCSSYA